MLQRVGNLRTQSTTDQAIPAPSAGWVRSGNITTASPDQAEVLDNYFPTAQGAKVRGGCEEYANVAASVKRLFAYEQASSDLFASTTTDIFDCERINVGGTAYGDVTGLQSGDWSSVQTSTSGGDYLVIANGTDPMMYWDSSEFHPINDAAINEVTYDALTSAFAVGETVTGGTSGATAVIVAIWQTSATAGILKVGAITGGPFQDNEALTDSGTGAATANGASAAGSAITITGIATTSISQLWLYGGRLFGIEKNSLSAWYLPAAALGGAMTELPLGNLFSQGGTLMFGASWSSDSGSGFDDLCVFMTTQGEIAVFEGGDPSSTSTWNKVGIYKIAKPLNKHGFFKAGGDLAILTEDGIIPLSSALNKDRAALQSDAITYRIEDAWKAAVANRTSVFPITATLWQDKTTLLVGVPKTADNTPQAFVSNARTGAWARYTGWDVRCSAVSGGLLFYGNNAGQVMRAEYRGTDDGSEYSAIYIPKFQEFGSPAEKTLIAAAVTIRSAETPYYTLRGMRDYKVTAIPVATPLGEVTSTSVWGTGVWGTFVWGETTSVNPAVKWKKINGVGYSLSFGMRVTVNQTNAPNFEILASRIRFEVGNPL